MVTGPLDEADDKRPLQAFCIVLSEFVGLLAEPVEASLEPCGDEWDRRRVMANFLVKQVFHGDLDEGSSISALVNLSRVGEEEQSLVRLAGEPLDNAAGAAWPYLVCVQKIHTRSSGKVWLMTHAWAAGSAGLGRR